MRSLVRCSVLLSLLLLPGVLFAAGEVTGRISGYVYDPTGQALSSVSLTVRGSALLQPQERTTGDDGRFEFNELPPGEDYEIDVNVEGFQPIKRTGIKVRVGQTVPVDINLNVLTETATATEYKIVEKANPVINPDSAQAASTVTAEAAAKTPVFHQVERMASLAPGVSISNRPSTRGGLARWGKFYVDGMDTTDVSDGSITAPMNFESVENFEVITGGFDAQYNSLGMVENVVTKSGSNRWTYDLSMTLQPAFAAAQNQTASNQPDFTRTYVNSNASGPQTSFYSPSLNLGGPIIKDRLWFYASGQLNLSHRETPLLTPDSPFQENRPTSTQTRLARVKFTWQPTDADRVSLAFHYDHNRINNNLLTPSVSRDAEERVDRGGYFVILNYDHNFTPDVLFKLQAGTTFKRVNTDPEVYEINHFDGNFNRFSLGALGVDQPANLTHETKARYQFDPTLVFRLEQHQLKAGVQFSYQQDKLLSQVTGNQRYLDRANGVCDPNNPATFMYCLQRVDFYNLDDQPGALTTRAHVINLGAFIQDRWTVDRHLTVIPGFRVDWGQLSGDAGTVARLIGWGPRLSGTYDVFGDRKSLLVAGYGRSNDVGNIFVAQHSNPSLLAVASVFDNTTHSFPTCAPDGPPSTSCQVSGGATGRSFASGQKPPHVDEVTAGFHQEVFAETAVGVDLTYRYYGNMWADQEVNRIWDASGTQIVGYVDPTHPGSRVLTQARPDAYRRYWGMDLWTQGTPGRWNLLASYTLSHTYGSQGGDYFSDGYLLNPRMTPFYTGWSPDDQRHMLKASASYATSFGLDVGMRLSYVTGSPMWESFQNPADPSQRIYRSPRGTGFANGPGGVPNFNDPSTWVEMRNPSQFIVDLQARYNLGEALGWDERLELIGLVVNVLNNTEATSLRDVFVPGSGTFGNVSGRVPPLQAELMIRLRN